jgi:hypothetical protein
MAARASSTLPRLRLKSKLSGDRICVEAAPVGRGFIVFRITTKAMWHLTWGQGLRNTPRMRFYPHVFGAVVFALGLASTAISAEAPSSFKVGEFSFARPTDWQWVETTSTMRKAQLKVVGADKKENAEVVFFYFGEGGGGGTQANIDRWLAQFEEPKDKLNSKVEQVTVGQRKVSYVQAQGTYLSGMPGGAKTPQPNSMLMGAILESDQGNVFIRLTGPLSLAKTSQPAFRKMVEGAMGAK